MYNYIESQFSNAHRTAPGIPVLHAYTIKMSMRVSVLKIQCENELSSGMILESSEQMTLTA